jgi:peptidoglycan/LPS O-acetylase OafA/YrhL
MVESQADVTEREHTRPALAFDDALPGAPPVFRDHVRSLDGLRGVAVLMVLWSHSRPIETAVTNALGFSFGFGYLGVEIFFALSGFLITRILLWERVQGVPIRYFLARRFLRIFPIYYLTIAAVWFWQRDPLALPAALYVSNYYNVLFPKTTVLSHTWSLAVEEHFYILWPLVVRYAPRETARRVAQYVFPAVALACAAAVILLNLPDKFVAIGLIQQGSLCRMLSLGIGASLAFHERSLRAMTRRTWTILFGMAVAGALISQFPAGPSTERLTPLTKLVGFALFSGATMAALVRTRNSRKLPIRVLQSTPLTFVGRISYGVYLYHLPIYVLFGCDAVAYDGSIWKNLLAIAVTFAVAVVSFYAIESPILSLKKRFTHRARQPQPQGADWPAHEPKATSGDAPSR